MITSMSNPYVKRLRELAVGKRESESFIIEGEKQIAEINGDWKIESYAVSESFLTRRTAPTDAIVLADHVFERVSGTVTPQGIIAICGKKKQTSVNFKNPRGFYVICDRVSDPGNMGAIIRNAHGFGCDCLMLSEASVDVYNPKVLRASAGSLFHVPFIQDKATEEYVEELKAYGVRIIAAHPHADKLLSDINLTLKTAIVIGNEARGVSSHIIKACDELALIPMPGGSESLNAAVSCGIALYEAVRQRRGL